MAQTPQGYAIYQVTEIQPPQTPTFEQIKAQVEDQFKAQRAQALLAQKTQELSDRARAEHDLKKAAKELGATVKTSDLVNSTAQVPDVGAMTGAANVAFGMAVGEISGPIQGSRWAAASCSTVVRETGAVTRLKSSRLGSRQGSAARPEAAGARGIYTCRTCATNSKRKARSKSTSRKWSA